VKKSFNLLCLVTSAFALGDGIPNTQPLAYSGVLLSSVGVPVTSIVSIGLALFDDAVANAAMNRKCDTPPQTLMPDDQGRFRIVLDPTCLAAVKANSNLWVQLIIGTSSLPRAKLGAVPYAVEADRASNAVGPLAQQVVPPGAVMAFNLASCPAGWAPLAGATGRTIIGVNAAGGNGLSARALGATFGEENHQQTVSEMPSHAHGLIMNLHTPGPCGLWTVNWALPSLTDCSSTSNPPPRGGGLQNALTVQNSGGSVPLNVMQPSLALLYCQKS